MRVTKVLAVLVVLVSASNAELNLSFNDDTDVSEVFDVAPSTNFFIGVYQDTAEADEFWIGIRGPASYSGYGTLYPAAPDHMVVDDGGYGYGWLHGYITSPWGLDVGKWWDLELHCEGQGDAIITLYNSSGYYIIDTITVHQIPEPMIITLLAFGGLLLRKRRKF